MKSVTDIDQLFESLSSKDDKIRYPAFLELQKLTEEKVEWIYDKWYLLIEKLSSENSFQRSIGFILLANLAKSDKDHRIEGILNDLLRCTDDEKFITSRQVILNLWKVGICSLSIQAKVVAHLEKAWTENPHLKTHANLIKMDIISSLWNLSKLAGNKDIERTITSLIGSETDENLIKKLKKIKSL
jgi:hypothetical protein